MIRRPVVAGAFYPGTSQGIESALDELWPPQGLPPEEVKAVIVPHAGWVYSGKVAALTFARVQVPKNVVLMGPNHTGMGKPAAIMTDGAWLMPGGQVELDREFGCILKHQFEFIEEDAQAHLQEHSLEVQLPFLSRVNHGLKLTPLCLSGLSLGDCLELGRSLARSVDMFGKPVLLVSSTDMSHYETVETARLKDRQAIDRILEMDPEGLYHTVRSQGITMCGFIPTVAALAAALELGATEVELIRYATSGDVNHDYQKVVGYAGLIVK